MCDSEELAWLAQLWWARRRPQSSPNRPPIVRSVHGFAIDFTPSNTSFATRDATAKDAGRRRRWPPQARAPRRVAA
eukprot:3514900-Prymnesium_polylepis.1